MMRCSGRSRSVVAKRPASFAFHARPSPSGKIEVVKIEVPEITAIIEARSGAAGTRNRNARSGTAQGSAAPAALLAVLLLVLVIATAWIFIARHYAAPESITSDASLVDRQYRLTLYVTGAIFILAQLGLAFAAFRFRDRGQRARFSHGSIAAEATWISVTLVLFIGLGIFGRKAWADARFTLAPQGVLQVEVTENQFVFNFRYPGPDGKFGRLDPALVNAPAGNPLGLDPNDPAGRDDVINSTLTVPVNRPVELLLRSQDVIHNFFVRELRLQQDAVPGMVIPIHFTPERIGRYEIVCTQLCGLGHYKMRSFLDVVSAADYDRFLSRQSVPQAAIPQAAIQ
jgi:cytochrome c oxidase subunit 2